MKGSGYIVTTSSGKTGKTKHSDKLVNGKVQVYCNDGTKLLCDRAKLKYIGFNN
jgi:hypothetical protein